MWFAIGGVTAALGLLWLMTGSPVKTASIALALAMFAGLAVPLADALRPRVQQLLDHIVLDLPLRAARARAQECRTDPARDCLDGALQHLAALKAARLRPPAGGG